MQEVSSKHPSMGFSKAKSTMGSSALIVLSVVLLCAIHAAFYWVVYIQQPLVDEHAFRQTQTALSAFYLFKDGVSLLDYQTPAIGSPWSVPFEFPTFQLIVAGFQGLTGVDLSIVGRVVSILLGIGCLGVGLKILQLYKVHASGLAIFTILYLVSPIYLYWNRTFMIESTALFFSLVTLLLYWHIKKSQSKIFTQSLRFWALAALLLSLSLGLVTKATTALPVLLFIALDLGLTVASICRHNQRQTFLHLCRRMAPLVVILIASVLVLKAWTYHADQLKAANLIGSQLTSAELADWNFGDPMLRLSRELWLGVLFNRMFTPYGCLPIVIVLVVGTRITSASEEARYLLFCFLFLALVPLLIFPRLHIVHTYYQCANQVFLLLALALSSSLMLASPGWAKPIAIACMTIIVVSFLRSFATDYLPSSQIASSDQLKVGQEVRKYTRPSEAILVFGDDWNSAIAFYSQRRSLTVPDWPTVPRGLILADPPHFLAGMPVGAIVLHNRDLGDGEIDRVCATHHSIRLRLTANWLIYRCVTLEN